jgi:N-methylhydantoinase A
MPGPIAPGYRIAADIGGTFTDIACLSPAGDLATCKLPSTPDDYARAIVEGICALAAQRGIARDAFTEVLHASTVATNAILEGKGAETALITTEGFRDVLELRRIRVPRLYEPLYCKPPPLVPRRRRYEISERIGPKGEILKTLDLAALRNLAAMLAETSVEAVAICFLHSYVNPAHEREAAAILRAALPGRFISVSSDVLPEIREYERTSTTVVNAYVGPVVARYLRSLQARLKDSGIGGRLLMMQSGGGAMGVARAIARPAQIVESGPAAGVIGAARLGVQGGYRDIITFDMGGTTAKASLIEDGRVVSTDEYEVGGGISLSSKLAKGGGYALKLPVIDVSEVGAGGGSIVRIDAGGALKVGPQSAGAVPGPACYGAGCEDATVTDANVALGYLNPTALAGGAVRIDAARARTALARIAASLDCSLLDAAYGVHRLANATMMRAVKAVSTYRGRDPRDFTLFAFGGNGGVHAAALARELQMRRVVIPPGAGVFSAVGLLFADIEAAQSAAYLTPLAAAAPAEIERLFRDLEARVLAELDGGAQAQLRRRADLRYAGQGFELSVDVPRDATAPHALDAIRAAFEQEHERSYGHILAGQRIDFVTLRVAGALPHRGADHLAPLPAAAAGPESRRPVYFGAEHGSRDAPVIGRAGLGRAPRPGPLVIEEYEGTTIVPPDATAARDMHDNIVIELLTG